MAFSTLEQRGMDCGCARPGRSDKTLQLKKSLVFFGGSMKTKVCLILSSALLALTAMSFGHAGTDVKTAADDTGKATKKAAVKTGHATKKAAVKTGDATETAAKDTGKGTEKVAKDTGKGTEKV